MGNDREIDATIERHAYHVFQILDHVESTPIVTNRSMAKKLNVSVKLAHELLNKLVSKGLLHGKKRHSRRWDYFLTPRGLAEKARLTYEFLDFSMQFYREARRRSSELLADLKRAGIRRVAFLGTGELAEIAYLGVSELDMELVDVLDDATAGRRFLHLTVRPISEMKDSLAEKIVVTMFDVQHPMSGGYLPEGVPEDERLVWIFANPQKTNGSMAGE